MEQTTDGTISYRLSISRSHRSTSSVRPSSGLADVMLRVVSAGLTESVGLRGRGGVCGGDWISWPQPSTCADLQTRAMERKCDGVKMKLSQGTQLQAQTELPNQGLKSHTHTRT